MSIKIIIIFSFVLVFLTPCFADIDEARNKYINGNTIESLLLYEKWLQNNQDSSDFTSVLLEISELNGDIHKIASLLEKQTAFVQERDKRKTLYKRLAQFYELSADLHNAQLNYQKAALISLEKIDYEMLLSSGRLLLLEGELLAAESQLEEIIISSSDQNITEQAKLLFTILRILNSDVDIDYTAFPFEKSESIYLMYLIAKSNSETVTMDILSEKIVMDFETSPEAFLIRNELSELPDIITSFGLLSNVGIYPEITEKLNISTVDRAIYYMIQAGSFRDPENAHYLTIDLEERGFEPEVEEQIINGIKYYKVLLYFLTQDELYQALNRLKENGFEGFPVY